MSTHPYPDRITITRRTPWRAANPTAIIVDRTTPTETPTVSTGTRTTGAGGPCTTKVT